MERRHEQAVSRAPGRVPVVARVPVPDAFALPRAIGNQSFAALARREQDRDFKDAGSGHSVRRIQVNGVKGGFTDMAMVILPDVLPQDGGAVEVLLFMHGFHVRGAHGYEQKGQAEGDDRHTLFTERVPPYAIDCVSDREEIPRREPPSRIAKPCRWRA